MTALNITKNPCVVCGLRETIGIVRDRDEITFWCPEHLPDEFRSKVGGRSDQEMFDAWAMIEQARDRARWAAEAKLRGDDDA